MKIFKRIAGRWLMWLVCGALWGVVCGAIVGACFAASYLLIFDVVGGQLSGPRDVGALLSVAFYGGVYIGAPEGAAAGALAFGLAGLMRVWRVDSQTDIEIRRACRAAFLTSIAGALSLATVFSVWCLLGKAQNPPRAVWWLAAQDGFLYGSQAGFCLGLALGALAPGLVEIFLPNRHAPDAKDLE